MDPSTFPPWKADGLLLQMGSIYLSEHNIHTYTYILTLFIKL